MVAELAQTTFVILPGFICMVALRPRMTLSFISWATLLTWHTCIKIHTPWFAKYLQCRVECTHIRLS